MASLTLPITCNEDGFVKNVPGPYQPAQGVIPNNVNPATPELDVIDSKGFIFSGKADEDGIITVFAQKRTGSEEEDLLRLK